MSDKYLNYIHESKEEDDIKRAIRKTKIEYKRKRNEIKQKIEDARVKYSEYSSTVGHTIAKEVIGTFEDDLIKLQKAFGKQLGSLYARLKFVSSKKGVAAVAVSGIILASYHLYKVYIRDYSQECKSKKGIDKILCYRKARLKALQQRIIFLKKSINQECNKTEDPTKCKIRIANEIEKLNKKVERYRELI